MKTKASIRSSNPCGLVRTQSMRSMAHTYTVYNELMGGLTTLISMTKISSISFSRSGCSPRHVHSLLIPCCFFFVLFAYYFCFILFCLIITLLFLFSRNKCYHLLSSSFWMSMWLKYKRLVTLQHLVSLASIFSMLCCNC